VGSGTAVTVGGVELRVLGPLAVHVDGSEVTLGGARARALLARLLLARGRAVSLDRLVSALWDGEPPRTARQQIHKVVSEVRGRLPGLVETVEGVGYRARVDDHWLDANEADELLSRGDPASIERALALWRGDTLAGIDGIDLRAAAEAWDERRFGALERWCAAQLGPDGPPDGATRVGAALPDALTSRPWREDLHAHLMVALARQGRTTDALAAYARLRRSLADELGVDPGTALRELHGRLVRGEFDVPAPVSARVVPRTLPYDLPDFTGRVHERADLAAALASEPIVAIDGMAGVGKTVLALHAAHAIRDQFPDGQFFLDLRGHTPGTDPLAPTDALARLLRAAGVADPDVPDDPELRAAAWRSRIAGRRMLVVLDNAATAKQVRDLLPGDGTARTLVTSRTRLVGLDGAACRTLDVMAPDDALDLLGRVAGVDVAGAHATPARAIVDACGHLPLAIRLVAARWASRPGWTAGSVVERLADERAREVLLDDGERGVAAAFAVSYEHVSPRAARTFRLLAAHPAADFDALAAAAMSGRDVVTAGADLDELLDAHLLEQAGGDRYRYHDLLRGYGRRLLGEADGVDDAARRLRDYYLAAAVAATDHLNRNLRRFEPSIEHAPAVLPDVDDIDAALRWLEVEHTTLVTVALTDDGWQLTAVLRTFLEQRGYFADWRTTHVRALAATTDRLGLAVLHANLGALEAWSGAHQPAMDHFAAVLALAPDHPALTAAIHNSMAMRCHLAGDDRAAVEHARLALAVDGANDRLRAGAWCNLALASARLGEHDDALRWHHRAVELAERGGEPTVRVHTYLGLGETLLRLGSPAAVWFERSLELSRHQGTRIQEAIALDGLAHVTGDLDAWRAAAVIFDELGLAQAELVRRHLADPDGWWCDLCAGAGSTGGGSGGAAGAARRDRRRPAAQPVGVSPTK
jgi:DNA-binding SARP family transcriptional activator/tetratricopeptide (TPR) repeat protein